jgi:hypothetical protein
VAVGAVGQITGGFFNPARFLGPAIVFGCDLGNIWVYVPAQFFGGLLAMWITPYGQLRSQLPQPMQLSAMNTSPLGARWIASGGQSFMQ